MIHFDFTVDDIEAINIIDSLHSEVLRYRERGIELMPRGDKATAQWYFDQAEYIEGLIKQMKNTKI